MKRVQFLAYDRLDLVVDFRCQKHDAIHGIHRVPRKEFGEEFNLVYIDDQMLTILRNQRSYLLHKCVMKPQSMPLEMWYNLLDRSQTEEFERISQRNRNARSSQPTETYLQFCGQGGILAYASRHYGQYGVMPSPEQVAQYKEEQRQRYLARQNIQYP
jgi:hypothetical protein